MRLATLALSLLAHSALAIGAEVVFEGTPSSKIEIADGVAAALALTSSQANEYKVKIVREGNSYFWASRDNVPLLRHDSGIYATYVAINGAGYVRTLNESGIALRESLPPDQREKQFAYMEHLVLMLGSITYFGK